MASFLPWFWGLVKGAGAWKGKVVSVSLKRGNIALPNPHAPSSKKKAPEHLAKKSHLETHYVVSLFMQSNWALKSFQFNLKHILGPYHFIFHIVHQRPTGMRVTLHFSCVSNLLETFCRTIVPTKNLRWTTFPFQTLLKAYGLKMKMCCWALDMQKH